MQFLHKIFEWLHPHFDKEAGGKLWRLHSFYEATETFVFVERVTTRGSVHLRDAVDYKRIMMAVVYSLIPCTLMAMYNVGYQANVAMREVGLTQLNGLYGMLFSLIGKVIPLGFDPNNIVDCFVHGAIYFLPVYITTMVVGGMWEMAFAAIRGHDVNEGFFVTGLLFPLTLPPTIPLWQVAVGISFGVVIGKEVFGGTGRNFLNPALVGRAYLFFAHAAGISGNSVWVACDGFSHATPLTQAMSGGTSAISASFFEAFIGRIPGSMGETSTLACIVGLLMLWYFGVASLRITFSMLLSAAVVACLFNSFAGETSLAMQVPAHWHLVLGGLAFAAVFMATDPVTASMTGLGKIIYGVLVGTMVMIVRVMNPAYPEGAMLAILFGNMTAPLIDWFIVQANIRRRRARVESTL
ncbi:MAG: NADH:ubiquinone reductase (Na(+)-transporting) subunit B [Thermoguttaceae bacterium]